MVKAAAMLSVVIPARNAADTLAETFDSLLAQTHHDWEAIVVDDGSIDSTKQIAETYVGRDRRFRLLSDGRPPEGASAARNRGIAEAKGRWLLFLDSDDWIQPTFMARMIGTLDRHRGTKVVYCASRRVSENGSWGPSWLSADIARAPFEVFARCCPAVIHSFVLDRALVVELGGFDTSLRTGEDWDLWQRVARTGTTFRPVADPLAFYRARANSLSSDLRTMMANARIVIDRAFGPDPRVRCPAPRHAAGADPAMGGTAEMAIACFALWCAAFEVADGGAGDDFLLPMPPKWGIQIETYRLTILRGLTDGRHSWSGEHGVDDPALLAAVRRLLVRVEHAAQRPGLARAIEFELEPEIFKAIPPTERLVVGRSLFVRRDVRRLQPLAVPPGIDAVNIDFRAGTQSLARAETPAFGSLSTRDLTSLAVKAMSPSLFFRASGLLHRPEFWLRTMIASARLAADLAVACFRRRPRPPISPRALVRTVMVEAALATASPAVENSNEQGLAALIAEGRIQAAAPRLPRPPSGPPMVSGDERVLSQRDRRGYWEAVYRKPDPWAYVSEYEQVKYRRTLDLLPSRPIGRALEVACSEGMFTAMLAPRVGHLTAADISETALERARARCRSLGNIDYCRLDFFDEELPHDLDLLVCSEVLYYLADRTQLTRVSAKLAAALVPGGHLLAAHLKVLQDDPAHTGIDWPGALGAKTITEALCATPGLALERSLETDLYRIDLFRRLDQGQSPSTPRLDTVALGAPPEPDHARSIVWGGAEALRSELQIRESTGRLAILAYHRIAEDGPPGLARYRTTPEAFAEQMRWLRRNGYHAVTSVDIARHMASGRPFEGRPIMISFDDAYRDFHQVAWPILRAHDFCAEVFVVTDRVGGTADWDAAEGAPAPLMGWTEIQALSAAGVHFGSHMASHSHMAALSNREIVLEAARSRAVLERALGQECLSIATPYGETNEWFLSVAAKCGYEVGITVEPGHAGLGSDPLRLPRVEVQGGWALDTFIHAVRPELPAGRQAIHSTGESSAFQR